MLLLLVLLILLLGLWLLSSRFVHFSCYTAVITVAVVVVDYNGDVYIAGVAVTSVTVVVLFTVFIVVIIHLVVCVLSLVLLL